MGLFPLHMSWASPHDSQHCQSAEWPPPPGPRAPQGQHGFSLLLATNPLVAVSAAWQSLTICQSLCYAVCRTIQFSPCNGPVKWVLLLSCNFSSPTPSTIIVTTMPQGYFWLFTDVVPAPRTVSGKWQEHNSSIGWWPNGFSGYIRH